MALDLASDKNLTLMTLIWMLWMWYLFKTTTSTITIEWFVVLYYSWGFITENNQSTGPYNYSNFLHISFIRDRIRCLVWSPWIVKCWPNSLSRNTDNILLLTFLFSKTFHPILYLIRVKQNTLTSFVNSDSKYRRYLSWGQSSVYGCKLLMSKVLMLPSVNCITFLIWNKC